MTDRYEKIRAALAMGPTPGPFSVSRSHSPGNQELIIYLTYKDEYGLPEYYCTVRSRLGGELGVEANAALIAACDSDTIRELLAERDALAAEVERLHEQLLLATVDQATADAEANDAHAENKRLAKENINDASTHRY